MNPRALLAHLSALGETELADLLRRRPEATLPPVPSDLPQLAARLLSRGSMTGALSSLTLAEYQLGEAAAALGDGWTPSRMAALLGLSGDTSELTAAIDRLMELALIWPVGEGFSGEHLTAVWDFPLDLGPPASELLDNLPLPELRQRAGRLGISTTGNKPVVTARIVTWLSDPDNVVQLVSSAPANVARRLGELATQPAPRYQMFLGRASTPLPWATQRGLLVASGYPRVEWMPREVALALRGTDYVAPFEAAPPPLPTTQVAPLAVARESGAAIATSLAAVAAVARATVNGSIPLLKNGTVGVRAMRALAKRLALDEERVRLTIELLGASGFAVPSDGELKLAPEYTQYAAAEPGDQLLELINAWLQLPATPFAPGRESEPALYWSADEAAMLPALRLVVLRLLAAQIPEGTATTAKSVAEGLRWYRPVIADLFADDLEPLVEGAWREAHAIGLLAFDAQTSLSRRMASGTADGLREQAASAAPNAQHTAVFQADLTVVVPGSPTAAVLSLLDGIADPESRSGAWTWRFSPGSVRRALDAGHEPDDLRTRLTEIASGHQLPQPLTYLIDDVARQYGRIQLHPVGCCLSIDDEALLAEVLATKRLRALGLHRIAPTVLISAQPVQATLTALREAGYAPREVRVDGSPVLQVAPVPTVVPETADYLPADWEDEPADPVELARRLHQR